MDPQPFKMLPPGPDVCPICAVAHPPDVPHDRETLYYQMRFNAAHGRWPTWADAIAHCTRKIQDLWKEELTLLGAWSEPAEGGPIADPPHESFHQVVEVGEPPRIIPWPPPEPESEADALDT